MAAYKRTIYLINPGFQIKFSVFVTSLVFISSLIYPAVIYETYTRVAEAISDPILKQKFLQSKIDLIQLLVLFELIFTALVFVICIFQSHKIAGPLYKLQRFLKDLREGNSQRKLVFRKGDNFKELADDYNLAVDTINRTMHERTQKLDELSNKISEKINESQGEQKDILNQILLDVTNIKTYRAQ